MLRKSRVLHAIGKSIPVSKPKFTITFMHLIKIILCFQVISVRFDPTYKGEIVPEKRPGGICSIVLPFEFGLPSVINLNTLNRFTKTFFFVGYFKESF